MNWITNYVRPTINSIFSRREVPENLWTKCDSCGTMLFHRELSDNLNVCTQCGNHMAIGARERLIALFDGGVFVEVQVPEPLEDPLKFRDQKKYPERMRSAQKSTGEKDAMIVAEGDDLTLWDLEIGAFNQIPSNHKKMQILPHTSHMTLYSDKSKVELAAGYATDWFVETLKP